jgi:hypothetical protein
LVKILIVFGLLCCFINNPMSTYAEEKFPKPPIRDIINWLDQRYRKDWTLEQHVRYECEAHEASKLPEGKKRIKHFKIVSVNEIGDSYMVIATYELMGKKCEVTAEVIGTNGVWTNQELSFSYQE